MVNNITATNARAKLGSVLKKVHSDKEYFVIEKDGIPLVGMMDIDEFEDYLDAQNEEFKKECKEGYQEYLDGEVADVEDLLAL